MISCQNLFEIFKKNELTFFSGVPDSTFKDWMKFLDDEHGKGLRNIIAVNECEAAGICAGYHLATGKVGVVYMQNSGLGKIVDPHTSLLSSDVYSIPAIYMIGWRGEPGEKDEPQHKMMGRITNPLLDVLEIPCEDLPDNIKDAEVIIKRIKERAEKDNSPVALVIKKGILEEYASKKDVREFEMNREDAIKTIVDCLSEDEVIVSTTGKTSRELFEHRVARGEKPKDFYTVGSMGCASSIALGIVLEKKDKKVFVFDGDGAVLMQMGTLGTIGHYKPKNFYHIVFDNNCHDSTGGQPTVSDSVDFDKIALSCGYENARQVSSRQELIDVVNGMKDKKGPNLIVVKVKKGSRENLGRPTTTPIENKEEFIKSLRT